MGSTISLLDRSQVCHSQGAPQFKPSLQPQGETKVRVSESRALQCPTSVVHGFVCCLRESNIYNFLLCFALSFLSQLLPRAKGKEKTTSLEVRCLQGLFL